MTCLRLLSRFVLLSLLSGSCSHILVAQGLAGLLAGKPSPSNAPSIEDPLRRDTPRSAIRAFLEACHNGRYVQASLYLDLRDLPSRQRTTQGPELAKQLADILDRDSHFELGLLSDSPSGESADGQSNRELLVSVPINGTQIISIYSAKTRKVEAVSGLCRTIL